MSFSIGRIFGGKSEDSYSSGTSSLSSNPITDDSKKKNGEQIAYNSGFQPHQTIWTMPNPQGSQTTQAASNV